MRLAVIYNICGIQGFQNFIYYEDALRSVLNQKGFDVSKVIVSSCMSNDHTVRNLTHKFKGQVAFNWIAEPVPLCVSFNHTVRETVKHLGEFDAYLYLDSGINFWDPCGNWSSLRTLWETYLSKPDCAIMAAMPSNDDGSGWWGISYLENSEYTYQIGQTTNLHCQIYSEEFRKAYDGKLHCDIFANDTSESVTSYLTAAINRKFMMTNRIQVFHNAHLDGASFGFRGGEGVRKRLFMTEKTMDERYAEGHQYGFGYEECNGNEAWLHDPDQFVDGVPKQPKELHEFLKRELFLSKEQFDYDSITHQFVEGE